MKKTGSSILALFCFFVLGLEAVHAKSLQERFFSQLLEPVQKANQQVLKQRAYIKACFQAWQQKKTLQTEQEKKLGVLAKQYQLSHLVFKTATDFKKLLMRVDIVPTSMVLAQAANESAWGRSRFARKGHNYFGQWCFKKGCGIVPKLRPQGAHYEVAKFASIQSAIASYLHNLNTNNSYGFFRQLRAKARRVQRPLAGLQLSQGLTKYSERGKAYVESIIAIIKIHHLEKWDAV